MLHNDLFEDPSDELARLAQETIDTQTSNELADIFETRKRCERVITLHEQGFVLDARDNFHAALVMLYGERVSHYQMSRTCAYQSAKDGEERAWTLYAMAWDRWLLALGKPQRFGTQIVKQHGEWSLSTVDPAVTDNERAFYGVPPLFVQEQRARYLQREEDRDIL
jgi:hypothetical protein